MKIIALVGISSASQTISFSQTKYEYHWQNNDG